MNADEEDRCDGDKGIGKNIRKCVLPLDHYGDCRDDTGWFEMPEQMRRKPNV